jgi:AraC-like DNA-binding protein
VTRVLSGAGHVFGMAFRPGCFRPFLGAAVSTLTGRSVEACEIFGECVPRDPEALATFLIARLPPPDPTAFEVADLVERTAAAPEVQRVDQLARREGLSVRRLQRLFSDYVGVGPKWVIRRYRLHEVTERLAEGGTVAWARLAADLGYADQAHLVRDFAAMFGEPPTRYAMRYPGG